MTSYPLEERSRTTGWWGMLLLIATEATLFGVLVASYFYLRYKAGPAWPPEGIPEPEFVVPLIQTVILVASSIPLALAAAAVVRGLRGAVLGAFALAFVLEVVFVVLQIDGWNKALQDFTPQTNAYGSLYYTLTGAHFAHLLPGMAMLVWGCARAWLGHYAPDGRQEVVLIGLYTHFVNAVAIAVFLTVYVAPRA